MAEILVLGFHASGRRGPRHIRPVVAGAVVAVCEEDEVEVVRLVDVFWDRVCLLVRAVMALAGTSLETLGW